ncbi:MAG: membrane integrity-associated transporter subunit PqiC [Proteobacteria bacterium]|nr:membrane integrity-associated transporter subunit PqiC [Pseudomonadota bacterium]
MMTTRFGTILLLIGLAGCIGGGASAPHVRQYILEYPPPSVGKVSGTGAVLKVERFTAARHHAGPAMLYRQGPFRRDAYRERRWRVPPGDMVTDFLQRDLRHAGLFRAVLAARDPEETRFVLMGGVDEFGEVADGERRKAVLAATVTLLDLSVREIPGRVVFQKNYRTEAPIGEAGDSDLAESMSRAMAQFSTQVIADIASALKK